MDAPRSTYGNSVSTFVFAFASADGMSPPSRFGMPQHVCSRGKATEKPLCSSTCTAAIPVLGML
jgi:hypothetical protein